MFSLSLSHSVHLCALSHFRNNLRTYMQTHTQCPLILSGWIYIYVHWVMVLWLSKSCRTIIDTHTHTSAYICLCWVKIDIGMFCRVGASDDSSVTSIRYMYNFHFHLRFDTYKRKGYFCSIHICYVQQTFPRGI